MTLTYARISDRTVADECCEAGRANLFDGLLCDIPDDRAVSCRMDGS